MNLSQLKSYQVVLFPYTERSILAYQLLKKHGISVISFWDNYKLSERFEDIPVCKPNHQDAKDSVVLVTSMGPFRDLFFEQAKQLGCTQIFDFGDVLEIDKLDYPDLRTHYLMICYAASRKIFSQTNKFAIPSLEVPITDRCSLKCRDCSNLMQYFVAPKDAEVDETIHNIERVLESVDYIEQLRFLGGEPFVCKNLYRYVNHFVNNPKIGLIHIYTNGTIVPQEKNLTCLKNPHVFLSISNYGDVSKNIDKIEYIFQKERILYYVQPYTKWTNCADIKRHNRTNEQQKVVFENCCANTLMTLRNGRLFACPFIANGWALQAIPERDTESIIIEGKNNQELRQDIIDLSKKLSIKACDYCNGRPIGVTDIPAAIQVKSAIPYIRYGEQ